MRVLICGGGVIGACTAYFLARRGVDVIVVERTEVACAASGKAGGFLALDWCAGSPLDSLARRSFALHAELAGEMDTDWAYRRMNAYSGVVVGDRDARRHTPAALDWLSAGTVITHRLGTPDTTASVNPRKFTTAMMRAAQEHGAQVRAGQVTGLARRGAESTVNGVEVDGCGHRGRRYRYRDGALVDTGCRMGATAPGVRTAKPEPRLRHRHGRAG